MTHVFELGDRVRYDRAIPCTCPTSAATVAGWSGTGDDPQHWLYLVPDIPCYQHLVGRDDSEAQEFTEVADVVVVAMSRHTTFLGENTLQGPQDSRWGRRQGRRVLHLHLANDPDSKWRMGSWGRDGGIWVDCPGSCGARGETHSTCRTVTDTNYILLPDETSPAEIKGMTGEEAGKAVTEAAKTIKDMVQSDHVQPIQLNQGDEIHETIRTSGGMVGYINPPKGIERDMWQKACDIIADAIDDDTSDKLRDIGVCHDAARALDQAVTVLQLVPASRVAEVVKLRDIASGKIGELERKLEVAEEAGRQETSRANGLERQLDRMTESKVEEARKVDELKSQIAEIRRATNLKIGNLQADLRQQEAATRRREDLAEQAKAERDALVKQLDELRVELKELRPLSDPKPSKNLRQDDLVRIVADRERLDAIGLGSSWIGKTGRICNVWCANANDPLPYRVKQDDESLYGWFGLDDLELIGAAPAEPEYVEPEWQWGDVAESMDNSDLRWSYMPEPGYDTAVWCAFTPGATNMTDMWAIRDELPERLRLLYRNGKPVSE